MSSLAPYTLVVSLIATLFFLGLVTFVVGIVLLSKRTAGGDIRALVTQTTRLAQKGIAEEVMGLVGNAADLIDAMNQLVRTTRGVGILLMLLGLVLMGAACWLALKLYQMNL